MEKNGRRNLESPDYIKGCTTINENIVENLECLKAAIESAENICEVNINTKNEKVVDKIARKTKLQDEIQNGSQTKMDSGSTENLTEKNVKGKRKRRKKKAKNIVDTLKMFQVNEILNLHLSDKNCRDGIDGEKSQYPRIPPIHSIKKKLIVLDLNGLLASIMKPAPKDYKEDARVLGRAIFKRPFCDDFLKFCFQNFDVAIWSSRSKKVVDRVVDYLLGDLNEKLLFCWDMSHTTQTRFRTVENIHKPLVFKELKKIWECDDPDLPWKNGDYNELNTLLLDDSPYKALLNPLHTAVFPSSYDYKDEHDNSLGPGGDLRVYLEGLLKSENFQSYVEQHPFGQSAINETNTSWDFYLRVLQNMRNQQNSHFLFPA